MVKPIKFEDWSQRFARHRAQKAVERLNKEDKITVIRKRGLYFTLYYLAVKVVKMKNSTSTTGLVVL